MTCSKIEVLIYQYTELNASERSLVKDHIQACLSCKNLLEQVNQQQNMIQQAATVPIEVRNAAQLTHKIMSAIIPKPKASWLGMFENRSVFMPRLAVSVAASLLVIIFAVEFFKDNVPSTHYSKISKGTSTLNTTQFLNTQWKRKEMTSISVSIYNCLKRDDCVFKNI